MTGFSEDLIEAVSKAREAGEPWEDIISTLAAMAASAMALDRVVPTEATLDETMILMLGGDKQATAAMLAKVLAKGKGAPA